MEREWNDMERNSFRSTELSIQLGIYQLLKNTERPHSEDCSIMERVKLYSETGRFLPGGVPFLFFIRSIKTKRNDPETWNGTIQLHRSDYIVPYNVYKYLDKDACDVL